MVALGLSVVILAAILTTFVFITKGGIRLMAHSDMQNQGSIAVQQFASDTRQASGATWVNSSQLILEVPDVGAVRYVYESDTGTLRRTTPTNTRTLATHIHTFQFVPYDRDGDLLAQDAANLNLRTKMVQMEMRCRKGGQTIPAANSDVISARYVLRNKTSS